jgi:hypothetical protein
MAIHPFPLQDALPCNRLAIAAGDFADLPAAGGASIARFLVPAGAGRRGEANAVEEVSAAVQAQPPPTQQAQQGLAGGSSAPPLQKHSQGIVALLRRGALKRGRTVGTGEEGVLERKEARPFIVDEDVQREKEEEGDGNGTEGSEVHQHQVQQPQQPKRQPQQDSDLEQRAETEGAELAPGPACGLLAEVDIAEQRRIMHDIQLLKARQQQQLQQRGNPRRVQQQQGAGKQRSIAAFLMRCPDKAKPG